MKFRKDNKIAAVQNQRWLDSIPGGVDFRVLRWGDEGFWLSGKGYGAKGDCGNGGLVVFSLTAAQRRRFERHLDPDDD